MGAADRALVEAISRSFQKWRIGIESEQVEAMAVYLELLERWNQAISLTSIRDRSTAILRHFVEPAMALPLLGAAGPALLDVGSGAGFPALPIKILEPDRECQLVESNGRKVAFLREVVEALELEGVEVLDGRLEELVGSGRLVTPLHVLTARAWSGWGELLGLSARLLVPGGRGIIFVGDETLRALRRHLGSDRPAASGGGAPGWDAASRAGWTIRRVLPLPHLDRAWIVALQLPGES